METLADFLGATDRFPDPAITPREPKFTTKTSAKEVFRAFLASAEYRQSLIDRVRLGTLPPALEVLMHHYAYGKPVEKVEVKDKTENLEELSVEEIEQRILHLVEVTRELRKREALTPDTEDTGAAH